MRRFAGCDPLELGKLAPPHVSWSHGLRQQEERYCDKDALVGLIYALVEHPQHVVLIPYLLPPGASDYNPHFRIKTGVVEKPNVPAQISKRPKLDGQREGEVNPLSNGSRNSRLRFPAFRMKDFWPRQLVARKGSSQWCAESQSLLGGIKAMING